MNFSFCPGCVADTMARLRAERRTANNTWTEGETFYGRPVLRVVNAAWNLEIEINWDRSPEHIEEMVEFAETLEGAVVTLAQEVYLTDGREGTFLDEGYEIQVYPRLALREGNGYLPVPADFTRDNHTTELVN